MLEASTYSALSWSRRPRISFATSTSNFVWYVNTNGASTTSRMDRARMVDITGQWLWSRSTFCSFSCRRVSGEKG